MWINEITNSIWVLTSIILNQAVWTEVYSATYNASIVWNIYGGVGPLQLFANNGYYLTNAAAVGTILPVASVLGSMIYLITSDASAANAGFTIAQNAGQYIVESNASSTIGVGGSLSILNQLQTSLTMQLICTVANTEWTVFSTNVNPTLA